MNHNIMSNEFCCLLCSLFYMPEMAHGWINKSILFLLRVRPAKTQISLCIRAQVIRDRRPPDDALDPWLP